MTAGPPAAENLRWKWPTFALGIMLFAGNVIGLDKGAWKWAVVCMPMTLGAYVVYRFALRRCRRDRPGIVEELRFAFAPIVLGTVVALSWFVAVVLSVWVLR